MKIKLPNPDDFDGDLPSFFDQLELAIYHARKSYEKMFERYDHGNSQTVGAKEKFNVQFLHPKVDYDKHYEIIDNRLTQEIEIEIQEID